jgi:hypothetical protein
MRAVAGFVEIAHLRGDIRLEEAVADDEQQQPQEEELRHHQGKFADAMMTPPMMTL